MTRSSLVVWGCTGGIAGLASPILGLVWVSLSVWRHSLRQLWLPALVAALVVLPWVIRNAVVFEAFIPTKSNAGFELYQSLHDEPTGVVTRISMVRHPYGSHTVHGRRYRELGEIEFVAEKSKQFRERLSHKSMKYLNQVAARFEAATWRLPNWLITVEFSRWHRGVAWLYPWIFVGFFVFLLTNLQRNDPWVTASKITYVAFLLPYVLVSFYERYAVPLWLLQPIFSLNLVVCGRNVIIERWPRVR